MTDFVGWPIRSKRLEAGTYEFEVAERLEATPPPRPGTDDPHGGVAYTVLDLRIVDGPYAGHCMTTSTRPVTSARNPGIVDELEVGTRFSASLVALREGFSLLQDSITLAS